MCITKPGVRQYGQFPIRSTRPALGAWLAVMVLFSGTIVFAQTTEPVDGYRAGEITAALERWAARCADLARTPASAPRGWQSTLLPETVGVDRVEANGVLIRSHLTLPADYLATLTEDAADHLVQTQLSEVRPLLGGATYEVNVRAMNSPADAHVPLASHLPAPVRAKADEASPPPKGASPEAGGLPIYNPARPQGALSGKTVFLSPGHGWTYVESLERWATQRGNTWGLVEDLSNGEAVLWHLARYLHNAGANVWPCRERDFNTNMVIIDNSAAAPDFTTTGSWASSVAAGNWHGDDYQYHAVNGTETAVARYTPDISVSDYYAVYVWTPSASNRSTDARVRVNHTGGTTGHVINMQQDGNTWRFLGMYYFRAGRDPAHGSVEISNQGSDSSKFVIADAVRFGGGMGDYVEGGTVSGKPRWEESGRYFGVFMGHTDTPYSTVTAMPRYAKWESESWEDPIYVSWHSNAFNGSGRGTDIYVYASGQGPGIPGTFDLFDGVAGSNHLATRIWDEAIGDMRTVYESSWKGGKYGAWFGELNPTYNDEMPACLIEVGYHDNQTDAGYIADPGWRDTFARAVYKGIVDWWYYDADGPNTTPIPTNTKLPEPPTHLAARNLGNGTVRVSWQPPPHDTGEGVLGGAATGYLVCVSSDGFGFNDGTATTATSMDFEHLPADATRYFHVIATNAGGQSFPSEIVGTRVRSNVASPILVVNGFDRLDRYQMVAEDDPYSSNDLLRERPFLMNHYGYIRTYAAALEPTGAGFDACANEAVRDGVVLLRNYRLVIWQCGEESNRTDTLDAVEQTVLQAYLDEGGDLFISGSEIAWELVYLNAGATFYRDYLKADYVADAADTYVVAPESDSLFANLGSFSFDDGSTIYNVQYADVLLPRAGATTALSYSGGTGGAAGIAFDGDYRLVNFGFPFETIQSASARQMVMQRIVDFMLTIPGDFDRDGDVDLDDFAFLQGCLSGTGIPHQPPACTDADLDHDSDVDASDIGFFIGCVSGADVPGDRDCTD